MLYEDCRVGVDEGESIVGKINQPTRFLRLVDGRLKVFASKLYSLSLYITPSYTFYLSCLRLAFHIRILVFPNHLLFLSKGYREAWWGQRIEVFTALNPTYTEAGPLEPAQRAHCHFWDHGGLGSSLGTGHDMAGSGSGTLVLLPGTRVVRYVDHSCGYASGGWTASIFRLQSLNASIARVRQWGTGGLWPGRKGEGKG